MALILHELRQNRFSFLIWSISISLLMAVCIFLFPEIRDQSEEMNELFSSLGSFSSAFGMDTVSIGSLPGFYSVECGNILGIGGAIYSGSLAAGILSKEEGNRTADYLLAFPVSRIRVGLDKFASVIILITCLNLTALIVSILSIAAIGEGAHLYQILPINAAYYFMQIETAMICFGLSAFFRKNMSGLGIGIACLFYFMNLVGGMSDSMDFLKRITPFGYCGGLALIEHQELNWSLVGTGLLAGLLFLAAGLLYYRKKDIY